VVKLGRTHLQDATPLTLARSSRATWRSSTTASRTWRPRCRTSASWPSAARRRDRLERPSRVRDARGEEAGGADRPPVRDRSQQVRGPGANDALVHAHGALKTVAASLMKIANDVRWLASGPRCGIGELTIPEKRAGQLDHAREGQPHAGRSGHDAGLAGDGDDVAINIGGASGNFELNVFKPLLAHNFLQSCRLIADGSESFREHCVVGIEANQERSTRTCASR